jgi:hypothetical protein
MKRHLLFFLLLCAAASLAQVPQTEHSERTPAYRPFYVPQAVEVYRRFQAVENTGNSGFYWLNTANADLWRLDPETMEWIFLGSPRGSSSGRNGQYQLLSDRRGGVYILNTDDGEGWWTDGTAWKEIGEPSRRQRRIEN